MNIVLFILAALMLVAVALTFLMWPLLRQRAQARLTASQNEATLALLRDQQTELDAELAAGRIDTATHQQSSEEIALRALEASNTTSATVATQGFPRRWALTLGILLPCIAAGLYVATGTPTAITYPASVATMSAVPGEMTGNAHTNLEDMASKLSARLEKQPDDLEGWFMLGRTYAYLGRHAEAEKIFRNLLPRMPNDPDLLADLADSLASTHGGNLDEEPAKLIEKALQIAPNHLKALNLSASLAFNRGQYATAGQLWERMLAHMPADNPDIETIRANINEIRTKLGQEQLASPAVQPLKTTSNEIAAASPASASIGISGTIKLSPDLAKQVAADSTVFIFARSGEGGPPLAAIRLKVADLPAKFDFTNTPLIMSERPVPENLHVGARISSSGNATPASGDPESGMIAVEKNAKDVLINIDHLHS
ncbi:c-type cytochrome biogenesis protein CcmI [Uliginosibacterium gangwonense]|uniref:c-type cytochrome biogenesis protein CcmI n=1 Tax=Uliginosibacterium gangwonense TaxID=392736 RepID=UPI00038293DD|nr:c-type cytochrome biogenesis protein CcmI [Uliginosibacterium gangwonense]